MEQEAIQIFNNPEFGNVRVIGNAENPRFCLSDVCKILEIGNPSDVKKRLDGGVVSIEGIIDSLGREQEVTFVNEDGLYDVILDSRKPNAKRFRKWVTSEVLPSIRKRGFYVDFKEKITADFLRRMADALDERDKQIALLETQNAELQPKADYCDEILQCKGVVTTSIIAKDYGYSAKSFNKLLHELGIQFKQGDIWLLYQKYSAKGWAQTKTCEFEDSEGTKHCAIHTYWTQKGRLGLYHTLKEYEILPLIES